MDSVQVFVETVQQKREQLLGVLLLEAVKPRRVLRYCPLRRKKSSKRKLLKTDSGGRGSEGLTLSFSGATLFWVPLHSSITKSP